MENEYPSAGAKLLQEVLEAGPITIFAAFSLVASAALLVIWLYLVVRRRHAYPLLALVILILTAGGFSWLHYVRKLQSHNLTSIDLPPGYKLEHRPGDDTYVGQISKPGGLDIGIDIGGRSGLWANPAEPEKHIWVFERTIRGRTVFIGLRMYEGSEKKHLCVTYPWGVVNFSAEVNSEREIAEMLSIVLTYEPMI